MTNRVYRPSFFLFAFLLLLSYTPSSLVSAQDYYYYYDYPTDTPGDNTTTPICTDTCGDFATNSSACLKSCSTCGFDTTENQCIFIAVGSWGCPDGGDTVILSQSVANSCSTDALTVCDQVTAGFFIANCVSGGVYFFTFWSFIWVARSSGRYGPIVKYTVLTGLVNVAAFVLLAIFLYVYVYCKAAKAAFIVNAVISVICWVVTLVRACGWIKLPGDDDEYDSAWRRDTAAQQKGVQMTYARDQRQAPLKQIAVVTSDGAAQNVTVASSDSAERAYPTPSTPPAVMNVQPNVVVAQRNPERDSRSVSDSNPVYNRNISIPPANLQLDPEGNTPPQFTATIA